MSYQLSNYTMDCFVCKCKIKRGDEITQCIESDLVKHRSKSSRGRWVHLLCVPAKVSTMYYDSILKEMMEYYPEEKEDDITICVYSHDYWTHEEERK